MGNTLKRIAGPSQNGSTGDYTVFTGTASHVYTIRNIRVVNPTGSAAVIKFGIQTSAGTLNAADLILPATTIPAGGILNHDCFVVFSGTEVIRANVDTANALTVTVSGLDQV